MTFCPLLFFLLGCNVTVAVTEVVKQYDDIALGTGIAGIILLITSSILGGISFVLLGQFYKKVSML